MSLRSRPSFATASRLTNSTIQSSIATRRSSFCTVPTAASAWARLKREAEDAVNRPAAYSYGLQSLIESRVLAHNSLATGLASMIHSKLSSSTSVIDYQRMCADAYDADPDIVEAAACDLSRTLAIDPAADGFLRIYLFFKGFHCVQTARVAHHFWSRDRILASAVQSKMSMQFGVDIHPASTWGKGITMDHAGGCVIGETAVIGNNVYLMHDVTLGSTGTSAEHDRHPKVRDSVFLAAKSTVLGNVVVGEGCIIGSHALVNKDVPPKHMAIGVPAKFKPIPEGMPAFAPSGAEMPVAESYDQLPEGI